MFFDKKTDDKLHKGSVLVGYDLNNDFSQISCLVYGDNNSEVETVATVIGTKQYNIPMVLCKPKDSGKWLFGKDAINSADEEGSFIVTDIMEFARKGEMITIEGENLDPVALLALFIKRSLSLMSFIAVPENIGAIMFTVDELDDRMVEVLSKATANLNLKTTHIYFQSHTESFYYFMLHQPEDLWNYQVLVCEHDGKQLKTYRMERNKKTTPIVVLIEEQIHDTVKLPSEDEEEEVKTDIYKLADENLMNILKKQCAERIVSCAYLLGDGFRNDWARESMRFLCRNRRAFQGNNLFSKGACYAVLEKFEPSEACSGHIFLGADRLKSNVGMNVMRRGKESYYALLDAGENWYEVHKVCEFLLSGEEDTISFLITPLTGRRAGIKEIVLEGVPVREGAFGRYEMEISMSSVDCIDVKITDLGFGELFPAAGKVWRKQLAESQGLGTGNIILSTGSYAKIPYFFEKTYVNLFSVEELCFCLVENAELLDGDIVSDKLARWLSEQCSLTELADKLHLLVKEKAAPAVYAETILEYVGLYSAEVTAHTVSLVSENAGLSPYEKQKVRADHMLRNKRYVLALEQYSSLLARLPEQERELRAKLHHNMGVAYSRLFMFENAEEEFMEAYEINGNAESLEQFLVSKRLHDNDRDYVDYIAAHPAYHEISLKVERIMEEIAAQFDATQENRMLFTLRVCKEEGTSSAGDVQYYNEIERITTELKDDYRESVSR